MLDQVFAWNQNIGRCKPVAEKSIMQCTMTTLPQTSSKGEPAVASPVLLNAERQSQA